MQRAKQAVSDILSKDGHHTTTVGEDVNAAVTEERINPHQHEEVQRAVDREVHQHHHMTTVQPVTAKETLPEQHTHNIAPTQEKRGQHDNPDQIQAKLREESAKFKDTTIKRDTTHSTSATADAVGERVHHHVHEHIQPVVQKEVYAPQVVYTTVPVHEVHEAASKHHGTKVLPPKTLEEFKSGGGILGSKGEHRVGEHDGCPEPSSGFKNLHGDSHSHHEHSSRMQTGATNAGPHDSNLANKADPRVDSDRDGRSGMSGTSRATNAGPHNSNLANKADPRVDSDRDGKSGMGGFGRTTGDDLHRRNEGSGYALAGKDATTSTSSVGGSSSVPRAAGSQGVQTAQAGSNTIHSHTGTTSSQQKPSLLDKVNPFSHTN